MDRNGWLSLGKIKKMTYIVSNGKLDTLSESRETTHGRLRETPGGRIGMRAKPDVAPNHSRLTSLDNPPSAQKTSGYGRKFNHPQNNRF